MIYPSLEPIEVLVSPSSWSKKGFLLMRVTGIREALPRRVLGQNYYSPSPSDGRAWTVRTVETMKILTVEAARA
jgi:hypothetical protein